MKYFLFQITALSFFIFPKNNFGQSPISRRASQIAIAYENGLYHLSQTEGNPKLFVKSIFYRRDLPHWRKWFCRVDIGAVWYNNGWYLEDHFLFGRPIKKVDFLTGISLRSGNLPTEFLENDLVFLNPEILFVIRPRPFFKRLSVEARFNMAFFQDSGPSFDFQTVRVPSFGLSVGYILKKHPR